jgi:hypothetical protein
MRRLILTAVLCSLASWAAPLCAQRAVSLGVGGGVSFPTGSLGDGTGWNALGTLALGLPMLPMGLRLDGAHSRFDADGGRSLTSATLNLTYRLPTPGSPVSPYLIAGMGGYHTDCDGAAACSTGTRLGWNAGAGTKVRVLGLRTFAEARYHSARARVLPVTFGVTF